MSRWLLALLLALPVLAPTPARAGTACSAQAIGPRELAAAADTAHWAHATLEAADAPVALIARAGTDVGKYGLHYSHVGFVVRDHADGRWTVVHLLNRCGTDRSGIHAQGLVNFFADDLVNQDARIVFLAPAFAQRLAAELAGPAPLALHEPHYNVISRPDRRRSQNSTSWVLEMLAATRLPPGAMPDRERAQAQERINGFRVDTIRIPYSQRVLGGLFAANADFGEHKLATRVDGRYPVVTVRSILDYVQTLQLIQATRERRGGVDMATPGPA
jgi:hypothetical protein